MRSRPPAGTPICAPEEIPDGGGRMFVLPTEGEPLRVLILRSGEQFLAYENYCPHFGVPLADRDAQLILTPHRTVSCNTHYARFRWHDGFCEFGDCEGESLAAVPIQAIDGALVIA